MADLKILKRCLRDQSRNTCSVRSQPELKALMTTTFWAFRRFTAGGREYLYRIAQGLRIGP